MKRLAQLICIVLVFVTVFSTVAFAAETPQPRASMFFGASSVYFWHVSGNDYQVWFDVTAKSTMQELGASKIKVQRSTDEVNWTTVKTYNMADYSQMTDTNTARHYGCVPYSATTGYSYRAIVTLYAKNSNGTGEMNEYTAILDLR